QVIDSARFLVAVRVATGFLHVTAAVLAVAHRRAVHRGHQPRAAVREVEPVLRDGAPDALRAQRDVRRVPVPARDLDDVHIPAQRADLRAQLGQRRYGRGWAAERIDRQPDQPFDAILTGALDRRTDGGVG